MKIINNGETGLSVRTKINDNFTEAREKLVYDSSFVTRCELDVYIEQGEYFTDFNIKDYRFNTANKSTYYVSTIGNDSNDGLDFSTPLLTIDSALLKTDVETIFLMEGTYTVGTHITAETDIENINLIGFGDVIIDSTTHGSPNIIGTCYIENITFLGGYQNLRAELSDTDTLYCKEVKFKSPTAFNCLSATGGNYYLQNCECEYGFYDGFNYHNNVSNGSIPHAVEINCKSHFTGDISVDSTDVGNSANGSTMHNNGRIIRLNGEYGNSRGGAIADKEAMSYSIACDASNARVSDILYNENAASYWVSIGTSWIIGCTSYGSKYDLSIINGGTVNTDITFGKTNVDADATLNII